MTRASGELVCDSAEPDDGVPADSVFVLEAVFVGGAVFVVLAAIEHAARNTDSNNVMIVVRKFIILAIENFNYRTAVRRCFKTRLRIDAVKAETLYDTILYRSQKSVFN